ncbi:N-acetylglucosamine-6-phosphate deacetylase [Synechococcus sp. PCC 7502]|uniref:N-acetylglucosamine-6-phosphate deacetylase n=1 Tax=Synechococcus sp. PCC 7502 TaxID=1173263 RepID=UPI00029FB538|nr:N-acetylglucosamine-6-phosphate deacetylase [Synechococcus sp. PCC 7502]AFY72280.1 N-acetylglucosamine-6-phosphate deacetylase [Synechococcus sp. PCC 7502]
MRRSPKFICYSSGGIDLQINGALGIAFNELNSENSASLAKVCEYLWNCGIDGFLPTLVTNAPEKILSSLAAIHQAIAQLKNAPNSAQILGVHLECAFFHPDRRGAHPREYLKPLTIDSLKQLVGDHLEIIKLITLAPELDVTNTVIPFLVERGIIVSLGHSTATSRQAQSAFNLGATMVTHAFNAMPPLHHREPGLLGAAILNPRVYCGLIADGVHVHPQMVEILWRLKGKEIVLVSDALAPLGLPDGIYPWDDRTIEIKDFTARLPDGTLSGTTLSLFDCVQNLVIWGICSPQEAIALATESPRKVLNLPLFPASLAWYWQEEEAQLTWERCDGYR